MRIVNFASGINKIEEHLPLSEWAVKYISSNKLTRGNHSSLDVFRKLNRNQKDAIRYQLRKLSHSSKPAEVTHQQKNKSINYLLAAKIALGIWISAFLLFDIPKIYMTKGASPFVAWQAAVLVELCTLISSLSTKAHLRRIAFALFAYNASLFAVMELDQVFTRIAAEQRKKSEFEDNQAVLKLLKVQLKEQLSESSKNISRLNSDHARGYVTQGSVAFERVSKSINSTSTILSQKIEKLESEIQKNETAQRGSLWIGITSFLYFLLRCLLQGFSILLLKRENPQGNGGTSDCFY